MSVFTHLNLWKSKHHTPYILRASAELYVKFLHKLFNFNHVCIMAEVSNVTSGNTDFSRKMTLAEFNAKFGGKDYAFGETDNTKTLCFSVLNEAGNITSAYASQKLQAEYEATPRGKKFEIPENTVVAPWQGNDGKEHWVMFLNADIELRKSSKVAQITL